MFRLSVRGAAILVTALSAAGAVRAQTPADASPSEFVRLLTAAAKAERVVIVSEGLPTVKASQLPPASAGLHQVAEAFDYEVERRGGIVLLRKRYTAPEEVPPVTLAECAATIQEVARNVQAAFPHGNQDKGATSRFFDGLSPEENAKAAAGGLSVSALRAESLRQLEAYLTELRYGLFRVEQVAELAQMASATAAWKSDARIGITFGRLRLFYRGGDGSEKEQILDGGEEGKVTTAPDFPDTEDQTTAVPLDASLIGKPVVVFGDAGADQKPAVLQAIADVYGLRVRTDADGKTSLARPRWLKPVRPETAGDMLTTLAPLPVRRALHDEKYPDRVMTALKASPNAGLPPPGLLEPFRAHQQAMARILALTVARKTKEAGSDRVPVAALTSEEGGLLGVVLFHRLLLDYRGMPHPLLTIAGPLSGLELRNAVLTGGKYVDEGGAPRVRLRLEWPGAKSALFSSPVQINVVTLYSPLPPEEGKGGSNESNSP